MKNAVLGAFKGCTHLSSRGEMGEICSVHAAWEVSGSFFLREGVWLCFVPKFKARLGLAHVIPSEENQFQQLHLRSDKIKAMAKGTLCALSLLLKIWTHFILKLQLCNRNVAPVCSGK